MESEMSEMNVAQLGKLFPIILSESCTEWASLYTAERERLIPLIGAENIFRVSHIGSTSVPGLLAKPTIDMLLEIYPETPIQEMKEAILSCGYLFSAQPENPLPYVTFYKGYTPAGFVGQAYHLHIRYPGDWDELYFCRYLRAHPEAQARYAALKKELQQKFEHDREAYTEGKTALIQSFTKLARQELGDIYSPVRNR